MSKRKPKCPCGTRTISVCPACHVHVCKACRWRFRLRKTGLLVWGHLLCSMYHSRKRQAIAEEALA